MHYVGAVLPQSSTVMNTFTIAELRNAEVVKQFNTSSTLYVPPRDPPARSDTAASRLGIKDSLMLNREQLIPIPRWETQGKDTALTRMYGEREKATISQLASHTASADHKVLTGSPAMRKITVELGLNPALRKQYKADPSAFVDAAEGLTEVERAALRTGHPGAIHMVMKTVPGEEITEDQVHEAVANNVLPHLFPTAPPPLGPPGLSTVIE